MRESAAPHGRSDTTRTTRTPGAGPASGTTTDPDAALAAYGWDTHFADAFAPYRTGPAPDTGSGRALRPARVVRVDRGRCDAVTAHGPVRAATADVATADPTRALCTGDWVVLATDAAGGHRVRAVLPRRTAFVRSTSSQRTEGQVLAANVDHTLIAVSLAVEPDLGRVERFVSLAWAGGAQPLVVLTKADLVPDPDTLDQLLADTEESAPGVQVLAVSAETGEGVDVLAAVLTAGTTALLGQSGAGKSTLANALVGRDAQEVRRTRNSDGKGRHTTTTRDLLPLPGGGVLIDTPGLRGVGLWDADEGVGRAFSDIEALAADCRFHDCAHDTEPGCAVLAAVDEGALPHRRLDSYRKLLRENARLAARTDARLRAERKQEFKRRQALGRHMTERKRGAGGRP
ncbi:ribosome small subunit-dependent GTPase A [Streptomyces sp. Z26]|uniref:ribosome small subunit-dependent GTPase A n=1 Tax=Streptomyces sp. Z26 TaxID=2500177 RepID=UPI000EF1459D|nr:ribosome small subunit-dependent GTPase A [Streptomyces sp. Z26]RLL69448.1 ribosome small subunit-dependent GTPase A [Streptomyces sp. Z26]